MKKNVSLKILVILIILTICLISFVGIFVKDKNQIINIVPEYLLSMDLKGARVIKLTVDTSTKEITYDAEGNITTDGVDEEGNLKEGYTKKDEKINQDEVLTKENYLEVKKILEKRLEGYEVGEYILKQNTENGEIIIELPENTKTDAIISNLTHVGKFTIEDNDTNEILIDNKDLKTSSAVYAETEYGTVVYWKIEFNKEGAKKLEEISTKYISTTDEEGNTVTKNVIIKLDDEQILKTHFGETIKTGQLQLSVGDASTDSQTISTYIEETQRLSTILNSGEMPIKYVAGNSNYVSTNTNIDILKICIYVTIAIILISLLYLCIKYKLKGILASISYIGYIAFTLITFRYTNVIISVEALIVMTILLAINYVLITYILNKLKENEIDKKQIINKAYIKYTSILIPILLMGIAFTFVKWTQIASIGMAIFWGLIIMFIYNYIVMNILMED